MAYQTYIEDIFINFYDSVVEENPTMPNQDLTAIISFYSVVFQGTPLTQNQANFILKLLDKYKLLSLQYGLDYRNDILTPKWKHPFRVLDLSKKIFVEKDNDNTTWVCIKFPYQLKKEFEDEFEEKNNPGLKSSWNHDRRHRQLRLYDANLVHLYEFALRHNFEIDDTFMIALAEVEEIWQNQDDVLPFCTILSGWVVLGNSSEETDHWFKNHATGNVNNDLLLAKSMGYRYLEKPQTTVQKIANSPSNSFWIKNNYELFSLYKDITGKICIVLDRTSNTLDWLERFVNDANAAGINRGEIRVCFRESKDTNTGINQWIKTNGVGGKVDEGRILIFEYKPAKWLFKQMDDVKMLVTNNLYPPANQLAKDWFTAHPCVIYLGDIKPVEQRGQRIVEL
jgi:hypothetical protein